MSKNKYNDMIADFYKLRPKDVSYTNNTAYFYYHEQLFIKALSLFKFTGLPDYWDEQYILRHLLEDGVICVTKINALVYPLRTSVTGYNIFDMPTNCKITNAFLEMTYDRTVGDNCEILYLLYNHHHFYNVMSIIKRYAIMLAQCDASLNSTLMNSRVAIVFECNNSAEVESAQTIYDDITAGRCAVFENKGKSNASVVHNHILNNVKQTFVGNELMDVKRSIMNEFLTEIGINNANTDKKERLITDEANANNEEIKTNVELWLDNLKVCCNKINKMFDLNIGVELRHKDKEVIPDEDNVE